MLIYTGHIISILMFVAVSATAVYMLATMKHVTLPPCYLWIPRMIVVVMLLHSTMFFAMQADYIIDQHGRDPINDPDGVARVMYNIFHGFALVSFTTGMNIFFRWRRKMFVDMGGCPRRRKGDSRNTKHCT